MLDIGQRLDKSWDTHIDHQHLIYDIWDLLVWFIPPGDKLIKEEAHFALKIYLAFHSLIQMLLEVCQDRNSLQKIVSKFFSQYYSLSSFHLHSIQVQLNENKFCQKSKGIKFNFQNCTQRKWCFLFWLQVHAISNPFPDWCVYIKHRQHTLS